MIHAGIGIIGCGNISEIYFSNLSRIFPQVEITGCCDLDSKKAEEKSREYGVPLYGTEELIARDDVDILLNLTTPETHGEIDRMVIHQGKHVYSEKPLALNLAEGKELLTIAAEKGVRIGCAPDTFLGAGIQTCRDLLDEGAIGKPVSAFAAMVCHGHEGWHPNPGFYYRKGGGPMLDMGPYYLTALVSLLGPVQSVKGQVLRGADERVCTADETKGQILPVEVFTQYHTLLDFTNGVKGVCTMSFDVWKSELPRIEIHGTKGSLLIPDPNTFGGPVRLFRQGDEEPVEIPLDTRPYQENSRGIGLADMVLAIQNQTPHKASGEMALHVLDIMLAAEQAALEDKTVFLSSSMIRPEALKGGFL